MDAQGLWIGLAISLFAVFFSFSWGEKSFKQGKNLQSVIFFFLGLINFVIALGLSHRLMALS